MARKKKKKQIQKRRAKSTQAKKKKRNFRLIKPQKDDIQYIERPAFADIQAPEGFRNISQTQAIMEFARPLMRRTESEDDLNGAMQAAMAFWNYALIVQKGGADPKLEKMLRKALKSSLGMKKGEADDFIQMMVERYAYLFPEAVQPPPGTPFMFIRKEVRHLIRPFDYDKLKLSEEIIPPDADDLALLAKLRELDRFILENGEYSEYESLFFEVKDDLIDRFDFWLNAKGCPGDTQDLSFCLGIYLDFIYAYGHEELVSLKSAPFESIAEFFSDFLLRKMMTEPEDYVNWPPAIRMFYRFLYEKKYIDKPDVMTPYIDKIEPEFIELLKRQFS